MFTNMESWAEIRRRVLVDGQSKRSVCREFDIHWDTLQKILGHAQPPGYRRSGPKPRPKLEPFLPVIHQIIEDDKKAPRKQRHTAKRIFERLRDEYGYEGKLTIVKEAVAAYKRSHAEVFVPLAHRPGEAQVDFGQAEILLDGQTTTVALFVMTLPYTPMRSTSAPSRANAPRPSWKDTSGPSPSSAGCPGGSATTTPGSP